MLSGIVCFSRTGHDQCLRLRATEYWRKSEHDKLHFALLFARGCFAFSCLSQQAAPHDIHKPPWDKSEFALFQSRNHSMQSGMISVCDGAT